MPLKKTDEIEDQEISEQILFYVSSLYFLLRSISWSLLIAGLIWAILKSNN